MRKTCLNRVYKLAKRDPSGRVHRLRSQPRPARRTCERRCLSAGIMEGITEQNVIGMAAGMAMEGYIPYVNTIATFITRRCYEQVAVDCCLHNVPVRLIANGGGLVYAPLGPTHLAIEDIAIMRALPNMTVVAGLRRRGDDAVHGRNARLAGADLHPARQGRRSGRQPAENGFAIGKAIAMRKAAGGRRRAAWRPA